MKRLLIVTTVPDTLRAFMFSLARHLQRQGWRVDAMACGAPDCVETTAVFDRVWDVPWSRNFLQPSNLLRAPTVVRDVVASEGYDVVHIHTPVAAFITRYALRKLRGPNGPKVVYTAHGFHFYRGLLGPRYAMFLGLEKLASRWTDYLVVVNQEDFESASRYRFVPPDRLLHTRGVGVDLSRFQPTCSMGTERMRVRRELGISDEDPLFLVVAEFIQRKRHADVIRALSRLDAQNAHLALAGIGPLMYEMRELARELGAADRVHFLGYRRDVPELMMAANAIVLASAQEGLPTCVIEAQCLGVPTIGSDIRGTRDLLQDACGLLFPAGDVEALRQAMEWIITHPAEAALVGEQGRRHAQLHSTEAVNMLYQALYERALEDHASEPVPSL